MAVAGVPARPTTRSHLTEPEALALLEAAGVAVPRSAFVPAGTVAEPSRLETLPGDRVVVKVVAPAILHKTEAGGVAFVAKTAPAVDDAIAAMARGLGGAEIEGFLVEELVEHDTSLAGELLVTLRWTPDFGSIVAVGAGGIHAELLARDLRPGRELAIVADDGSDRAAIAAALRRATVVRLATEPQRGRPRVLDIETLVDVVERLLTLGRSSMPHDLREVEINPMAVTPDGRLVALDVLASVATLGEPRAQRATASPGRLGRLLAPRSIGIVGVSSGENIGRTILRNVLRDGFDPTAITIVKPGATEIDGCRCVPDVEAMPAVDLLIVAISAEAAADLVPRAIDRDLAAAIVLIPGGFEETAAGEGRASRIRAALDTARRRRDGGPVVVGGNCMGVRSGPGHYDTLFIPETKLAGPSGHPAPLAIVAQSGAFAISRLSRLEGLDPRYVITVGNQLDLTLGQALEHVASDPGIRVIGAYVEGFAPLDGLRFLRAARSISARGGAIVLYRGGRTPAGASASASHTAAIAGDALVTETLARNAGVIVAESVEAFDDAVATLVRLDRRPARGRRLGALTNAGFECVAIADTARELTVQPFDAATTAILTSTLARHHLDGVVDVHNPFDLTPMGGDEAFADVAEAILASPSVDVAVIGNVPFTTVMRTLPDEGLVEPGSVAARLADLWRRTTKPWVTVVDAGPRYDPLARELAAAGIPVFRAADAAVRTLELAVERDLHA